MSILFLKNPNQVFWAILLTGVFSSWLLVFFTEINVIIFVLGILLGITLNYYDYGFTKAWTAFFKEHKTILLRSQVLILALGSISFFPLLNLHSFGFDVNLNGIIRPIGINIALGALMFGFGMQICLTCSSGATNNVGKLQVVHFFTFFAMLAGATYAAKHLAYWDAMPKVMPFSFAKDVNFMFGLVANLLLCYVCYKWLIYIEYKYASSFEPIIKKDTTKLNNLLSRLSFPYKAAILLVALNVMLLTVSGFPWSMSSSYPIMGINLIDFFGLPIEWEFWDYAINNSANLDLSILEHRTGLIVLGIIAGSLLITFLRYDYNQKIEIGKPINYIIALIGGSLIGFGSVVAYGCNIGAFLSSISSGSLHGWVWIIFAILGNWLGYRLRSCCIK